jgi:hypothetical protein
LVQAHPALNKVVHVLDRKMFDSCPKKSHVLDIPAQYLCERKDGTTAWAVSEPEDLKLLREFEWRFSRSKKLPCESVSENPMEQYSDEREWLPEDKLDIGFAKDLNQRYGR